MPPTPSRRAVAVASAYREMLRIIHEAQTFESTQALTEPVDPEKLLQLPEDGKVPQWRIDLVRVLSQLYGQAYTDAAAESEPPS